jgi:hypothetical protein
MTAKDKIHSGARRTAQDNWVVSEQEFHLIAACTGQCQGEIF